MSFRVYLSGHSWVTGKKLVHMRGKDYLNYDSATLYDVILTVRILIKASFFVPPFVVIHPCLYISAAVRLTPFIKE